MTEMHPLGKARRGTFNVELSSECAICLVRGIGSLIAILETDSKLQLDLFSEAFAILSRSFREQLTPAVIVNHLNRAFRSLKGVDDPYYELKQESIKRSREVMLLIQEKLLGCSSYQGLRGALAASITGNLIDFHSAGHSPDLQSLERLFIEIYSAGFAVDDSIPLWKTMTQKQGNVLVLADNAGESHFDIPLLQLFKDKGWQIKYCVKAGPIVNDATPAEIEGTEIDKIASVVTTGARAIGTPIDEVSESFLDLVDSSDLILSKGQANLETFPEIQRQYETSTFYILRAKCPHIARTLHVETGSNIVLGV
ncbi:MAG: DUF89 domain-containing protein [Promethearchaeota archaeon]